MQILKKFLDKLTTKRKPKKVKKDGTTYTLDSSGNYVNQNNSNDIFNAAIMMDLLDSGSAASYSGDGGGFSGGGCSGSYDSGCDSSSSGSDSDGCGGD